jgi:hypothetical protein
MHLPRIAFHVYNLIIRYFTHILNLHSHEAQAQQRWFNFSSSWRCLHLSLLVPLSAAQARQMPKSPARAAPSQLRKALLHCTRALTIVLRSRRLSIPSAAASAFLSLRQAQLAPTPFPSPVERSSKDAVLSPLCSNQDVEPSSR